jgi:hypothetical protein
MGVAAAFLLALCASPAQQSLLAQQPESVSRARIELAPDRAHIGEPIDMTIVVEHPEGANVVVPDPASLPRSLALVRDLGLRRQADPSGGGRKITRVRWQLMALEGGDVKLDPLSIVVEDGGVKTVVEAAVPALAVEAALAEGEDAPRPARGFRETPEVSALSLRGVLTFAGLMVAALVAFLVWRTRARRKPAPAPAPPALERLAVLETRAKAEPDSARELVFALTHLVREAVDAHAGASRGSMTDEEWSRVVGADERVPETVRGAVTRLLSDAERVKYARESPSSLGLREWITRARAALEALDPARREAA